MNPSAVLERVALMSLVAFAFYGSTAWYYLICITALLFVAIIYRSVSQHWFFWTIVAALNGFTLIQLWLAEGNHLYLNFYLSLAILTALLSHAPETVFRINARLIIGIVFAAATLWKLFTPSFISGDFFRYYLVQDDRLAPVGAALTDLSFEDVSINRERLTNLPEASTELISSPQIDTLASVLVWFAILLEGMVAACFMFRQVKAKVRDVALLGFLLGAYLLIPVPAFGTALACLGYGQSTWRFGRGAFLVVFIIQPLTTVRYYLTPL